MNCPGPSLRRIGLSLFSIVLLTGSPARAESPGTLPESLPGLRLTIGLDSREQPIPAWVDPAMLGPLADRDFHVMLVGGLDGTRTSVREVIEVWRKRGEHAPGESPRRFILSIVPDSQPSSPPGKDPGTGLSFPPPGTAYGDTGQPGAHAVWRWIARQAPDLVVTVRRDLPASSHELEDRLGARLEGKPLDAPAGSLVAALNPGAGDLPGRIPALALVGSETVNSLLELLSGRSRLPRSPASRELTRRESRTSLEFARDLARTYGHELDSISYIPVLALIARLRLEDLDAELAAREKVMELARPYLEGRRPALGRRTGGSQIAGHLLFTELARRELDGRALDFARRATELGWKTPDSTPEVFPFHADMSDAIFMATPLLVEVGRLAGSARHLELAGRHVRTMRGRLLREDGLYRHSPRCEAAWGRGNGFAALGLAWCLEVLPSDHSLARELAGHLRSHLLALLPHQDPTGEWHQVIDHAGSYREFSATCMVTLSLLRATRLGILESARTEPAIRRAWRAILRGAGSDGVLMEVCTGTGKQPTLRAYLDRKAILGRDARGGAMALMVAVEHARWEREGKTDSR